jgi:hypothetical protein
LLGADGAATALVVAGVGVVLTVELVSVGAGTDR